MPQVVNTGSIPRSSVERVMRRRDAIGIAALVALGLISSDAGRDAVVAAKKEKKRKKDKKGKNKQDASSMVAKWSRWHKNTRGQNTRGADPHQKDSTVLASPGTSTKSHRHGYHPWC